MLWIPALVLLLLTSAAFVLRIFHLVKPAVHDKVIAVMPFESVDNDPATSALGLGLTETVTAKLVQASDTGHVQLVSARELIAGGVKNAEEARREFGTDLVLEGSVQQSGALIRITCTVVDSKTRRQIAARTVTGQANEIFALQDQFVNELLDMLPVVIRPEQRHLLDARQDTQPNAYDFYLRGRGYLQEYEKPENLDSAIIQFERALQVDQKYAPAYAGLGAAYATLFEQRNQSKEWLEKTRTNCEQALAMAPDLAEAHTCLGHFYLGTGQYETAVKEFQQSLDLNKESDETLGGLADAYQKLGNTGAAEQAYRSAIALRPNYWGGYSGLGAFYYSQARYGDAVEMFRKVTSLAPENYRGYSNLGAMELLLGRYSDSIAALKTSIALRPDFESYGNLGTSYFLLRQFENAAQSFEEALRLDDKDWANWGNLGDALYQIPSRRSDAVHAYERASELANAKIDINPRDASALACLADYDAMLGKRTAAIVNLQRALKVAPTDADVHFRAAILFNKFGDTEKTVKFLKQAVDLGFSANVIRDTPDFDHLKNDARVRKLLGLN
jgi:serine/threonine-protein kinase